MMKIDIRQSLVATRQTSFFHLLLVLEPTVVDKVEVGHHFPNDDDSSCLPVPRPGGRKTYTRQRVAGN